MIFNRIDYYELSIKCDTPSIEYAELSIEYQVSISLNTQNLKKKRGTDA